MFSETKIRFSSNSGKFAPKRTTLSVNYAQNLFKIPLAFYIAAVYNHYNIAQITMRQAERVGNQWKLLNARGKKKPLEV